MNCIMFATSLHCLFGSGSLSAFRYDHPIESAWHKLEYNPAGGEAVVDRLVLGSWVIQRIVYTGRAMHLGEDGKWTPRAPDGTKEKAPGPGCQARKMGPDRGKSDRETRWS